MQSLEYRKIVTEIESLGIMPDRPPSLKPMRQALDLLIPKSSERILWRPEKTVVVAGTNGKGSVCATLETLFKAAGETVGLYTSPHLEETTERIRINGIQLTEDQFCQIYSEIKSHLGNMRLTHFETLTLMAAWSFFSGQLHPPVDRAIFEVGLGGKWDATNAIPHHHCVITQIGYDHQNLLGESLSEIASNKFGIIQKKSLVVHSALPQEIQSLATQIQNETQSNWHPAVPVSNRVEIDKAEPRFYIQSPWGEARITLAGARGSENTATALTYFQKCGYDPSLYLSSLSQIHWSGRMEHQPCFFSPCPVYLSGDHNPDGIQSLIQLLPYYKRKRLFVLIGIGKDKNRDQILEPIFSLPETSIFLTETPFKPLSLQNYQNWLKLADGAEKNPADALRLILKRATQDDLILVTGSLYLVGLIKKLLRSNLPPEKVT